MATFIQAVTRFGPRIAPEPSVNVTELSRRLSDTTGQRRGEAIRVLLELQDALLFYQQAGRSVQIPGIGVFRPGIRGDGRIRTHYRPDAELAGALDNLSTFRGVIQNQENIGLTSQEFKAIWDKTYPDDPLELPRLQAA